MAGKTGLLYRIYIVKDLSNEFLCISIRLRKQHYAELRSLSLYIERAVELAHGSDRTKVQ